MDTINLIKYMDLLKSELYKRKRALGLLTEFFNCDSSEIFYLFQKSKLPEKGKMADNIFFFFHGLGCTVKNEEEGWSVSLEFGSNGQPLSFDKGTLCHILSVPMNHCDNLIKNLQEKNIIKLADEKLYNLLQKNPYFNDWESEEQEMDAIVVDRFIIVEVKELDYK